MRKSILVLFIFFQSLSLQAKESVVLIHGFLLSHHHMVPIKRALPKNYFDICYFAYPSRYNTVCGHGYNLLTYLQKIAYEKPGVPIHFVTHSIGALILRCALNFPECPQEAKIGRAVMLAPPNQGSSLARHVQNWPGMRFIFGNKSGRELLTWGPEETSCLGQCPPCMQVLVLAGSKGIHPFFQGASNDRFLTVEETYLDAPHKHTVLRLSHGELINCQSSLQRIRDFLIYSR